MGWTFAGRVIRLALVAAVMATAAGAAVALPARRAAPPRVTIFGDSSAEVLDYVQDARQYLAQGLDVNWQLAVCRRLVELSCPYQGVRPPTVLDVVSQAPNGSLGAIAVVDVGYNDYVRQYRDDMDTVIKALIAKGVQHIVWTTMHEVRDDYRSINASIRAEAASWPQVAVADWNAAGQGQAWFNPDGIHLNSAGAWGLARLLRPFILAACGDPCQPPPPPSSVRAPAASYVIRATAAAIRVGTYLVWKPPLRGSYAQATAAFGRAAGCRVVPGRKSRTTWPPIGLTMQFIATPGGLCRTPAAMLVQTMTATGRHWKTAGGLAVGDPLTKLQAMYPAATAHAGAYQLIKDDRGPNHAQLSAVVRNGRVTGFSIAVRMGS